jgi:alkanesulfonate monooxygenase SsuD/methylene tetrahydromethanopterin reductase-like flavin-dependent oxidoreductase (luciferase family)
MRIGFARSQMGSAVGPETLVTAAKRAEDLGFDSLWVLDRILWPVSPRAPYPIGDGSLPVKYKNVLDPLETLTFAAAHAPRCAWHERPQPSLVQSCAAGAPVDHT